MQTGAEAGAERVCGLCGASGAVWVQAYVGGRGYVDRLQCRELLACWARADAQRAQARQGRQQEQGQTAVRGAA